MHLTYYPELGQPKPAAQIEASLGHYGSHYYLRTPLTLSGRGVKFVDTYTPETTVPGSHCLGWNRYKVTEKAFQRICAQYDVVEESLL